MVLASLTAVGCGPGAARLGGTETDTEAPGDSSAGASASTTSGGVTSGGGTTTGATAATSGGSTEGSSGASSGSTSSGVGTGGSSGSGGGSGSTGGRPGLVDPCRDEGVCVFNAPVTLDPTPAHDVLTVDLDGDSLWDIVAGTDAGVAVHMAQGNGMFANSVVHATPGPAIQVETLYGTIHLVVALCSVADQVLAFPVLPTGELGAPIATDAGVDVRSMDVSLISSPDWGLVVASAGDGTVRMLDNDGDGTLSTGQVVDIGGTPDRVAVDACGGCGPTGATWLAVTDEGTADLRRVTIPGYFGPPDPVVVSPAEPGITYLEFGNWGDTGPHRLFTVSPVTGEIRAYFWADWTHLEQEWPGGPHDWGAFYGIPVGWSVGGSAIVLRDADAIGLASSGDGEGAWLPVPTWSIPTGEDPRRIARFFEGSVNDFVTASPTSGLTLVLTP